MLIKDNKGLKDMESIKPLVIAKAIPLIKKQGAQLPPAD
jgi:hypothetical protein